MQRKAGVKTLRSVKELVSRLYIRDVQGALYSLFHHTNTKALAGIVIGKGVWMSRIDQMNDGTERFPDADKTYVLSLSAAPTENVAMWIGYGLPRKDAIRVRFPGMALEKICKANDGRVEVFPIKCGKIQKKRVRGMASLQYVGYVSRLGSRVHVRNVIYKVPFEKSIMTRDELMKKCGSFIKLLGWRYEQEVRLVVKLEEKIDAEKIKLDLTEAVEGLLTYKSTKRKDSKGMPSVIVGPWGDRERFIENFKDEIKEINFDERPDVVSFLDQADDLDGLIRESEYKGKIRLGRCDKCNCAKGCECCYCEPIG